MAKTKGLKVGVPQKRKQTEANNGAAIQKRRKRHEAIQRACQLGLDWLLENSLSSSAFKEDYFEKKPLHIQRSDKGFYNIFEELCSPEGLFKLLDTGEVAVQRLNMFRCLDGSNKELPTPPPQTASDVRRLFSEGWSIQWLQPQQEHATLARFVATLESQFGCLIGVNSYLTPPGVQGLAPHWDDVEVLVLQLAGSKAWQLHSSCSTSPLPPEAQSLPRYSSGDLPLAALSPVMMAPTLRTGDLLYFPRGTIHHAPNPSRQEPSVHLTISAFQRQTYFDLANKAFEETMAELWENDKAMRTALPWEALGGSTTAYPMLCKEVARLLRRAAEIVESEEKSARSGSSASGHVSGALADLTSDFVQSRMPPLLKQPDQEMGSIITTTSYIMLPDPSVLAIVPSAGDNEGAATLIHCLQNSQQDHMMRRNSAPNMAAGTAAEEQGEDEEEEEEGDGDDEEGEDENDQPDLDDSDEAEAGWRVSAEVAKALKHLCDHSQRLPLAGGTTTQEAVSVRQALDDAKVPQPTWPDVCSVLTQLAALGIVTVGRPPANGSAGKPGTIGNASGSAPAAVIGKKHAKKSVVGKVGAARVGSP